MQLLFRDQSKTSLNYIVTHIFETLRALLSLGVTTRLTRDRRRTDRVNVLLNFSEKIISYITNQDDLDEVHFFCSFQHQRKN
jgi:K+/H+ antiporter YhaU regulatory subunit KhtT